MLFDSKAPKEVELILFNKPYKLPVKYIPSKDFNMILPFHIRTLKNFVLNSNKISDAMISTVLYSTFKDPILMTWLKVPKDLWGEDMDVLEYLRTKITEVIIPKELHIYPYLNQTLKLGCDTNHLSICKKGTTFICRKDIIANHLLISAKPDEVDVNDYGTVYIKGKRSFY